MGLVINTLQAKHGDCFLLTYEKQDETFNLLIDSGVASTYRSGPRGKNKGPLFYLLKELKSKGQIIDLVIITHYDDDHIGGLIKYLKDNSEEVCAINSIWFNTSKNISEYFNHEHFTQNDIIIKYASNNTSLNQGIQLERLLSDIDCEHYPIVKAGDDIDAGPFNFQVLSPRNSNLRDLLTIWPDENTSNFTSGHKNDYVSSIDELVEVDSFEEDCSLSNASSIAFILTVDEYKLLFLGDAHDHIIIKSLKELGYNKNNRLKVDIVKLSHHGSKFNTSSDFLDIVDTNKYIISTNGERHGLPHKTTIARILKSNKNGLIFFNYPDIINNIWLDEEIDLYRGNVKFLNEEGVL